MADTSECLCSSFGRLLEGLAASMPPVEKLVTTAVEIWLWLSLASTSTASLKPREHLYQLSFSFFVLVAQAGTPT